MIHDSTGRWVYPQILQSVATCGDFLRFYILRGIQEPFHIVLLLVPPDPIIIWKPNVEGTLYPVVDDRDIS